mgnify:CR=1 FL=1
MLGQMGPGSTFDNMPHSTQADAKSFSQGGHCVAVTVALANSQNLVSSQSGTAVSLTSRSAFWMGMLAMPLPSRHSLRVRDRGVPPVVRCCHSAFLGCVAHVVSSGSWKQVLRSHATAVGLITDRIVDIARVAYMRLVGWWLPKRQDIGKAVGCASAGIVWPRTEKTVARLAYVASPKPALAGLVNMGPESLNVFRGKLRVHAEAPFSVSRPRLFIAARGLSAAPIISQTGGAC